MVMGVKNGLENINCEIFENFQDIFILCLTASSPSRWCTWLFYDTVEHLLVLFFAVKKLYVIVSSIKKKKTLFKFFTVQCRGLWQFLLFEKAFIGAVVLMAEVQQVLRDSRYLYKQKPDFWSHEQVSFHTLVSFFLNSNDVFPKLWVDLKRSPLARIL